MEEITIRCECGFEATGPVDDVVTRGRSHAAEVHAKDVEPDLIRAMAVSTRGQAR